jgi:hypothetical protein
MIQIIRKLLPSCNITCEECGRVCYAKCFQQNFESWTSGNSDIDKFIKDTQLSAHYDISKALEWIPYSRFSNITYKSIGIYKANWIDGCIEKWDEHNKNWQKCDQNMIVFLKRLNNPKNVTLELMNEVFFSEIS